MAETRKADLAGARRTAASGRPDIDAYWEAATIAPPRAHPYVVLLGLRPAEASEIRKRVKRGLGFQALERFQRNTQFSTADISDLVAIKTRTLHRRKEQGRLEPDESDRLLRVSRVFAKSLDLFEGDAEAARSWFQTPAQALGGEAPMALAGTDLGSREVEALIDRLEHGVLT